MIKSFLKRLRDILFILVKNMSFLVLKKLNPDFEFGRASSAMGSSMPGRRQTAESAGWAPSIRSAIVLNSDQVLLDRELQEYYLSGIFRDSAALEYVRAAHGSALIGLSFEETERLLEEKILGDVRAKNDQMSNSICAAFFEHKEMKRSNEQAYATEGKFNPNAVYWPDPTDAKRPRSLFTELPIAKKVPLIDRDTRIVSAGSCFATEIAHLLQRTGYNYLIKEENKSVEGSYEFLDASVLPNSSAAWGSIYNTPSFRQLVEKAFEERELPHILWTNRHNGQLRYLDPFRENIAFQSPEAYEENYYQHIRAAREAFLEMDVFIITLGLNEVWYFKSDGAVFSRSPWRTAPSLVAHKSMSVEENVNDLLKMASVLRVHNPGVSIICTLSPIALHATFRGHEQHIVAANAHSKAVLRVAAEEFTKRCKNAYYFPSYEVVTVSTEHPWKPNQRHVSQVAVDNVMDLFHKMYSKE